MFMSIRNPGFSVDWFAEKPKDSFICPICFEVLNDPHSCRNGHNFCESCILQALEVKQECPKCKIALKESILTKNLALRDLILELNVICPNKSTTVLCDWIGTLNDRIYHQKNCPEILVNCPLRDCQLCTPQCSGIFRRRDLKNHVCEDIETGVKVICDLSGMLKTRLASEAATVGFITRLEADGTVYCGQVSEEGEKQGYGTIYRNKHCICQGNFVNNVLHGDMCYKVNEVADSEYNGQMRGGLYHGTGKIAYRNGLTYEGQWNFGHYCGKGDFYEGTRHGSGCLKQQNGTIYTGTFLFDQKHGKGDVEVGIFESGWLRGRAVATFANGDKHEGMYLRGKANGQGIIYSLGGSFLYIGEFRDGFKHGVGVGEVFVQGKRCAYDGQWERGQPHGQGVLTGPEVDKFRYSGTFWNGKRQGQGKQNYSSGNGYVGIWKNDERHGNGTETFLCGDKYTGEFVKDVKEGIATYLWKDEEKFVGQWKNNHFHGEGVLFYADGTVKFKGQFVEGKKHHLGVFTWRDGSKFEGEYIAGHRIYGKQTEVDSTVWEGKIRDKKFHGQCTITYTNGDVYTGEVTNSKRNGHGLLTTTSGATYNGQWRSDKYHGQGTLSLADGTVYTGAFANGEKCGVGRQTWANGNILQGEWEDNLPYGQGTLIEVAEYGTHSTYSGMFLVGKKCN